MPQVRMPKMGDGMEEGTILRWLKQVGDTVTPDDFVAEVETDKANVEIPAEEAGTITRIVVEAGQTVPVGAVIAELNGDSSGAPPAAPQPAAEAAAPAGDTPQRAAAPAQPAAPSGPARRIKASPLAQRMARDHGIDLARIEGTGPGGRIVQRDIEVITASGGEAAPAPAAPQPAPAQRPAFTPASPNLPGADTEVSKMRRAIARHTVLSKQTVPHFYLVMPVDMDRALDLLADVNAQSPDQKVTVNDLVVKACAVALERLPEVNVSYTPDDKIRRYDTINIGVAVGTDNGLTIPVITDCGRKSLRQLAVATREMVGKARGGTLTPQDMSGGTFTVSNLGMFGIEEFMAIISPPEAAMLAVGAALPEAVPDADGSIVVRRRMRITLSCDHRAVDGLLGARFLQELRKLLEAPLNLLA